MKYGEDYFIRGKQCGLSLYEDYRWMRELTVPMVQSMIDHLKIERSHLIVDFGCARGYVVKAFRELQYEAWGVDVSSWAIENADEAVKDFVGLIGATYPFGMADWFIAKDVLEHVPQAADTVDQLMDNARIGVFAVVPLSAVDNQPYVVADYEKDVTHVHRLTLASWARMFMRPGWRVEASYRLKGVKDNYATWENGNGFLTARRCDK